jgi:hypothetical protein
MPRPPLTPFDYTLRLLFGGKDGTWKTRDNEGFDATLLQIAGVIALPLIRTGYWRFNQNGEAPEVVWDEGGVKGPRPSEQHQHGFAVDWLVEGLGLREFTSTSGGAIAGLLKLYTEYEAAPQSAAGKLPFVSCTSAAAITGRYGTSFTPEFVIVRWVDWPKDLPGAPASQPGLPTVADPAAGKDTPF